MAFRPISLCASAPELMPGGYATLLLWTKKRKYRLRTWMVSTGSQVRSAPSWGSDREDWSASGGGRRRHATARFPPANACFVQPDVHIRFAEPLLPVRAKPFGQAPA